MHAPERLPVELGERSYDILVGERLLATAGRHIAQVSGTRKVMIVTDETLAELHLATLERALDEAGISYDAFVVPAGEATKSFAQLERLCERLLEAGLERQTPLVALGGGVIGDLTGFAAAVLLRGTPYIQVPTTLLAQVDSSVGGKTGINTAQGKNLVGSFHQPRLVLADTDVLTSLSRRELLAGYAEVVKYGLIDDPAFFTWLEGHGRRLIAGDPAARSHAILTSCTSKARIVAADEREGGVRALLNLGHTFGHALEAECRYDGDLLHGEAVAIGMVLAFELSAQLGLCPAEDADRVRRHLAAVDLPTSFERLAHRSWDPEVLLGHMRKDKKVQDGRLTLVLARGIGQAFLTQEVREEDILHLLTEEITQTALLES
ncbi:3-dehydroquinate synthase [Fodinicurvata halophila]|uniref:3-dehydroquinate synthase n=1 Tax=Fodinicurvata halophila TaxID=1419723 RepID=A0ABV8UGX3_9PROT